VLLLASPALAGQGPRARDLGIPFDGQPGDGNAITDVAGVEVGFVTLISGTGETRVGEGPARTGVTAILPRGKSSSDPVFAGWFALNGNGEMTGTTWIDESGFLEGPIAITNTHSVGVVRDAVVEWLVEKGRLDFDFALPVVAETYDALNDVNGMHVKKRHAFEALNTAHSGPVAEGSVGGGTGMICHEFKGGTGRVAGAPVGQELAKPPICWESPTAPNGEEEMWGVRTCRAEEPGSMAGRGSIIIVVATDAPLLPHQLKRIAKRAALGVGRMGGMGENSSGDIFLAFSTANQEAARSEREPVRLAMLPNEEMDPLFEATVSATEEAIMNAMVAAETMTGAHHLRVPALPHDELRRVLREYGRLRD
jgi:L-aminopeptidase/D-esterase-like protein